MRPSFRNVPFLENKSSVGLGTRQASLLWAPRSPTRIITRHNGLTSK